LPDGIAALSGQFTLNRPLRQLSQLVSLATDNQSGD